MEIASCVKKTSMRDYLYLSSKVSDFTIGDYTFEITYDEEA